MDGNKLKQKKIESQKPLIILKCNMKPKTKLGEIYYNTSLAYKNKKHQEQPPTEKNKIRTHLPTITTIRNRLEDKQIERPEIELLYSLIYKNKSYTKIDHLRKDIKNWKKELQTTIRFKHLTTHWNISQKYFNNLREAGIIIKYDFKTQEVISDRTTIPGMVYAICPIAEVFIGCSSREWLMFYLKEILEPTRDDDFSMLNKNLEISYSAI